jgi:hypothetical protein
MSNRTTAPPARNAIFLVKVFSCRSTVHNNYALASSAFAGPFEQNHRRIANGIGKAVVDGRNKVLWQLLGHGAALR